MHAETVQSPDSANQKFLLIIKVDYDYLYSQMLGRITPILTAATGHTLTIL